MHDVKNTNPELIVESYQQFIDGLPVPMCLCDVQGKITSYNEAAAILWGWESDAMNPLSFNSLDLYDANRTPLRYDVSSVARALKNGVATRGGEIIVRRSNGEERNVFTYAKPVFSPAGDLTGAIWVLIDITDKKEKERSKQLLQQHELKKSEERYHKMIDEVSDYAILLLDKDGFIMNWNRGAEKIKGYTEKEAIGKNFRIFYTPEARENKVPEKLIAEAVSNGKAMDEGLRVRKDGTTFWGSIVITALHGENNEIIGFSKVTRDLTERKKADDELRRTSIELELQNKELARYAYVASHDLQEPLRKIQTFVSLLNGNLDDKEIVKRYIGKINSSAERMSGLIKDVLNFSRVSESEKKFVPVNLNEVLQNVMQDFELLITEKHAIIVSSELPLISGIPIQLHQLFSNLISNAIKFNEQQPRIEIKSGLADKSETGTFAILKSDKSYFKISVKDNGIGFDPQFANSVFDLFKRVHDTGQYPGTGLGLALCKKIAEIHGGVIIADSNVNQGTIFTIFLPVEQ